jgi:GT2 family glycosyltransferase
VLVVDRRPDLALDAVRALLAQDRPPQRLVTVFARDLPGTTAECLRRDITASASDAGLDAGFLESTLAHLGADPALRPAAPSADAGWLWWIHDDSRPAPDALRLLLGAVETSPSVTIAGCKQVELENPRHLLDVGLTVTRAAEPISLVEPGELDQGQYDGRTDTLAVSAPGMLVRWDVWTELGGIDPAGPLPAAVVDLCWRNRLAGHRVVVVPAAVVGHDGGGEGLSADTASVRATALWLRLKHARPAAVPLLWIWGLVTGIGGFAASLLAKEPGHGGAHLAGTLRVLAQFTALAGARRRAEKTRRSPRDAVAALTAPRHEVRIYRRSVLALESPDEIIGDGTGSTLTANEATGGHDEFAALATPERNWVGTGLVAVLLLLGGLSLVGLRQLLGAPALAGGSLLPLSASVAELWQHATGSWAPAGAGAAVQPGPFGLGLVLIGLFGQGSAVMLWLTILAMPLAAAGAWTAAGAVARGRGVRLLAALLWGLSPALLTASGGGRPGALIVHLALPWLALAVIRATGSAALRRPDPEGVTVDATSAAFRPGHRGVVSWTASGWTALLLAVVGACAPALFGFLVVAILLAAAVLRGRGRTLWWTPLPGLALFLPAAAAHWTDPRALLGDPGLPQSYDPAPLWQQLLGFPEAFAADSGLLALPWLDTAVPGAPWALLAALVVGVPVLLLAGIGAVLAGRVGVLARMALGVTVLALIGAALAPLLGTSVDEAGTLVTVHTGPFTSTALLGILLAAVAGLNGLLGLRRRTPTGERHRLGVPRRTAVVVLSVAACCSVVLTAGLWVLPRTVPAQDLQAAGTEALAARAASGESEPMLSTLGAGSVIEASPVRLLPATAADQGTSALATRTVVLERQAEQIQVGLASGTGPTLDRLSAGWTARSLTGPLPDPTAATPDRADEALRSLAAQLVSGSNADPRPALESFGAGFVVLSDPSGAERGTAASIDAVPGLAAVGLTDSGWLWRVEPAREGGIPVAGTHDLEDRMGFPSARVRIEDAAGTTTHLVARQGGTVDTAIPAAAEGEATPRRLVLAERADAGWRATLDGRPLAAVPIGESDWAQSFELPAEGGTLRVWHDAPAPGWLWWVPGLLLLFAVLLAIPSPTRRADGMPRTGIATGYRDAPEENR